MPYGLVSIYGVGSQTGQSGILQPTNFLWGTVDAISAYGIVWASPGMSVLFDQSNITCRLAYPTDNTSYTLIQEANLVCQEFPIP